MTSTPHSTLFASLSMAGTTSPDWRFSLRDPRGVADEYGQYSPGGFLSNVNTTTPGTATSVLSPSAMSCTMCRPQYEHMSACRLLNRCLHSRRINSRLVCRRVIPVNRDWGHCHHKSLISAIKTAWPVTLVISRNPGASLWHSVRALRHCSGPYRAAPKSVWRHRIAP